MIGSKSVRRWIFCAALLALAAPVSGASAQSLPYVSDFFSIEPQTYDNVPGVPDANGCVKMCFRDDSPCDPPLYKRTDNRCKSIDQTGSRGR